MEERITLVEEYLRCPVCCETLTDPVTLSCNHSFCSICLQQAWEFDVNRRCPMCRSESSCNFPPVNFALKGLADSFAEDHEARPAKKKKAKGILGMLCSSHQITLTYFCQDENRAVCPVCELSTERKHTLIPLEDAVGEMRERLRSYLRSLQDKKYDCEKVEEMYDEMLGHCEKQMSLTEDKIRDVFRELLMFLKDEQESRLAALREEREQRVNVIVGEMKAVRERVSSLSNAIYAVRTDLLKDLPLFLNSYKSTETRVRAQWELADPKPVAGTLIDVAQHLGNLSYRVWEKMKEKVHFSPVVLDPNSANPCLHLSEDLTSVRNEATFAQLPQNPERHSCNVAVLGSLGFTSGRHGWEVEVGDHPDWTIGVMRQSADRMGDELISPEYGVWYLCYNNGEYTNIDGAVLPVKKSFQRIKVLLDCTANKLSFYDTEDMSLIYRYIDNFTEELFPYFSIGDAGDAKATHLKICHSDISLSV